MIKFHHLERYFLHLFSSKAERAGKFVRGLGEGLRIKVMGARQDTLVDVIDMTTRFDEDFTPNKEIHRKKGLIMPPTKFNKVLSAFKGFQKSSCMSYEG